MSLNWIRDIRSTNIRVTQHTNKELRSFGFIVGSIFIIIGIFPLVHNESYRVWAILPGVILLLLASISPSILVWPFRIWMTIGYGLSWLNTRIILGILFFTVITPIGLFIRLFKKDTLKLKFQQEATTYRVLSIKRDPKHMERQF